MELIILGYMNAARPTIINWRNKRIRRRRDKTLGQIDFNFVVLLFIVADIVAGGRFSSVSSRRRGLMIVRRMMTKQMIDTARMIMSGKIKRRIRTAFALSRLNKSKRKILNYYKKFFFNKPF